MRTGVIRALIGALGLLLATQAGFAQGTTPPPSPGQNAPVFNMEQLDQILQPEVLTRPRAFGSGAAPAEAQALSKRRGQID